MRFWDIFFTVIFLVGIVPFFISWNLVMQLSEYSFIILDTYILSLIALLYFFIKTILKKPKYKKLFLSCIVFMGFILSSTTYLHLYDFSLYSKTPYLGFYTNPNDSNETIALYHFGRTLHSYNTLCHIKKIKNSNLMLFKNVDYEDVNGLWIIDHDNPIHNKKGLAYFNKGKVMSYQ